jgi:hypothetical protein
MTKKRKSQQPELISRSIEISSFAASVSLDANHRRGEDPHVESGPWLGAAGHG